MNEPPAASAAVLRYSGWYRVMTICPLSSRLYVVEPPSRIGICEPSVVPKPTVTT